MLEETGSGGVQFAVGSSSAQKNTAGNGGARRTAYNGLQEWSVRSAVAEALDHKADRNNPLISLGGIPSVLSEIIGTNADLYIRANHVYENAVSKETAIQDGRIRKNAHYHNLGEETVIDAIMALENPAMLIADTMNENPTVVAILPVRSGENMVYAALSFYSSDAINSDYTKRPHVVLTLSPIPSTGAGGRKNLTDTIARAVEERSIIFCDKKMTATLPVNAQNVNLGIVTDASVKNSLAQFQKNVKAFKGKYNIQYSISQVAGQKGVTDLPGQYLIDKLPRKSTDTLLREERKLVNSLGRSLNVPYFAKREFLRPITREISLQYLQKVATEQRLPLMRGTDRGRDNNTRLPLSHKTSFVTAPLVRGAVGHLRCLGRCLSVPKSPCHFERGFIRVEKSTHYKTQTGQIVAKLYHFSVRRSLDYARDDRFFRQSKRSGIHRSFCLFLIFHRSYHALDGSGVHGFHEAAVVALSHLGIDG